MGLNRSNKKTYILESTKKNRSANWDMSNNDKYTSKFWQDTRQSFFREHEDNILCAECLRVGMTTIATDVHHIEPIPSMVDWPTFRRMSKRENLEGLCHSHHMSITAKESNK